MLVDERPTNTPLRVPAPIASKLHLAGLLLILLGISGAGFVAQHHATAIPGGPPAEQLAEHAEAIPFYLTMLVMDWALFWYCYSGAHRRGGTLASLSGGRWMSGKDVLVDLAIAAPFWALWEGAAYGVHHLLDMLQPAGRAATVDSLLPESFPEIILWVLLCVTAGFCEEVAFRGYLQKQFHALTGSLPAAILLQGVVFGISHGYQGWKNVAVISVLGVLYGMLAAWRGNLRVNMISHAWSDLWSGWLQFLIIR